MELEEILILGWGRQQLEAELKTLILFTECQLVCSEKCRVAIPDQRRWMQGETRMEHAGVVGWPGLPGGVKYHQQCSVVRV